MKKGLLFILISLHSALAMAQGCSDAGFCTIPDFTPEEQTDLPFSLEFKGSLEGSEPGALIISPQILFGYRVSEKFNISVKLPLWFVNDGALGNVSAISDPLLSGTLLIYKTDAVKIKLTAGARMGIGSANRLGANNLDLPMDYQNSLGTTDLILGGSAHFDGLSVSLAAQLPIFQYNQNQNVGINYLESAELAGVTEYIRKADVMLRLDKTWLFGNWGVKAGVLPIFHIGNDEIKSSENPDIFTIEGSAGLTLNIPFGFWYTSSNWIFGLDAGFPVLTRDERPDGLTRRFVVQPRVAINF